MIFMLFKLEWVLLSSGNSPAKKKHTHKPAKKNDYNALLKAIPAIILVILLAFFIQWVIGMNIRYKRVTWQSDYFIAFMVTAILFVLLVFYETKLMLRRTLSWILMNNMFKLVMVIFRG